MITIQNSVFDNYVAALKKREIPPALHADYKKWLRYYLDFCAKYVVTVDKSERLGQFLEKLRTKKQTETQCRQAALAVSLYFESQSQVNPWDKPVDESGRLQRAVASPAQANPSPMSSALKQYQSYARQRQSQYSVAGYEEKSDSPEWDKLIEKLAEEIKVRHYSRNTLKTYAHWSRQFQRFLKNKPPQELSTTDVKEYLTYLAVKCKVAASTQNQALC